MGRVLTVFLLATSSTVVVSTGMAVERAYVANLLGNAVAVLDVENGAIVDTVPVGEDPNGIAIAPDGLHAYITNFESGTVSVLSTVSNQIVSTIAVGDGPVGIAIHPLGRSIYVVNKRAASLSAIDAETHTVSTLRLTTNTEPDGLAITPDGGHVWITHSRSSPGFVSVIDTTKFAAVRRITVGDSPNRVAITPDGRFAYVTNYRSHDVSVISTETGSVVSSIPVGRYPSAIAIKDDGSRAYVGTVDGIAVIDVKRRVRASVIAWSGSFRAIDLTLSGHFAWVTNFRDRTLIVVDTRSNQVARVVCGVGSGIFAIAIAEVAGPLPSLSATIEEPVSTIKLREDDSLPVRISVTAGELPLQEWTLHLDGGGGDVVLATGETELFDATVAELHGNEILAGTPYFLRLRAADAESAVADTKRVLRPDPQFTVIPLDAGRDEVRFSGLTMDASGTRLVSGGSGRAPDDPLASAVIFYDTTLPLRETIFLQLQGSGLYQLSGDGTRLVFSDSSQGASTAVSILDLDTRDSSIGPILSSGASIRTDTSGGRIIFESTRDLDPNVGNRNDAVQLFLYDHARDATRQITPESFGLEPRCGFSRSPVATISADGGGVAFASANSFDLAPGDGCHVFVYDVDEEVLRWVTTLPERGTFENPTISGDGRWATFVMETPPSEPFAYRGARLNLETGSLEFPLAGLTNFPTFDAVISEDGSTVIVSSRDDLDPRVGNPDHNQELFAYDLDAGVFTQITETTEGVTEHWINGGLILEPRANADASVVAFHFVGGRNTGDPCTSSDLQRDESNGFAFRRVRAVRRRPGNHPPILDPIDDLRVVAGDVMNVDFSAVDDDGDLITLFAQVVGTRDVPPDSTIVDHLDGTAALEWRTEPKHVGVYPVRAAAFDEGGGTSSRDFTIAVCHEIDDGLSLSNTISAIFESDFGPLCRNADRNGDGLVSAGDLIASGSMKSVSIRPSP